MATDLIMPKSGLTMEEGTVVEWLVQAGDPVTKGQAVLQVETDKVVIEVEAPTDGAIGPLLIEAGQTVPIGALLARIYAPGEKIEAQAPPEPAVPPPPIPAPPAARITPLARRVAADAGVDVDRLVSATSGHRITAEDVKAAAPARSHLPEHRRDRIFSSPRARKKAREAGIDWRGLPGSGPRGRVIEQDVHQAAQSTPAAATAADVTWLTPTPASRVGAERMAASFATAPHFYLTAEVLVANLLDLRRRLLPVVEDKVGARLTVTDLLLKVAAAALAEQPRVNAFWEAGRIGQHQQVNICLAVSTEEGLVAPALRQVDTLSLGQIATAREALVERTRQGRLTPDDLQGGTFTLSNLGMYRVDTFQAILNPPQAAILAVGRFADRPVGENGQLVLRPTAHLSLSCDHRVLDGALGAQFLGRVAELIEEPYSLLA